MCVCVCVLAVRRFFSVQLHKCMHIFWLSFFLGVYYSRQGHYFLPLGVLFHLLSIGFFCRCFAYLEIHSASFCRLLTLVSFFPLPSLFCLLFALSLSSLPTVVIINGLSLSFAYFSVVLSFVVVQEAERRLMSPFDRMRMALLLKLGLFFAASRTSLQSHQTIA